jgi:cytochrome c heme-lyase
MGAQSSKAARGEESLERREQRVASLFVKVASSSSNNNNNNSNSGGENASGTTTSEANFMPKNLEDDDDDDDDDRKKKEEEARRRRSSSSSSSSPSGGAKLSKLRETSSIPISQRAIDLPKHQHTEREGRREERAKNWTYPSPKMFYEAIKRKGWQPPETDIDNVVKIHNVVNERCWQEILKWEKEFHPKTLSGGGGGGGGDPGEEETNNASVSLLRFKGKPRDYSPKARLLNALGYKLPFDRHDWIIDRNGEDVRYVIDFYNAKVPPQGKGDSSSLEVGPIAMHVDVRPALDSLEAFYERAYMQMKWISSGRWMR